MQFLVNNVEIVDTYYINIQDNRGDTMRIDMSKVVKKYDKYLKSKTNRGEIPMKPEAWLWHNLDRFNVSELVKLEN